MKTSILRLLLPSLAALFFSAQAQTSYFQDFSANIVPSNFQANGTHYTLSAANQELKIIATKADLFNGVNINFSSPINLTQDWRKTMSFSIKTDTTTRMDDFLVQVFLYSAGGNTAAASTNASLERTIKATGNYRTVSFNWVNPSLRGTANFSAITRAEIVFMPRNFFSGVVYLDNIAIGGTGTSSTSAPTNALTQPYFIGISNQATSVNSGTQTVKILRPTDATGMITGTGVTFSAISSNPSLIPNPTFINPTVPTNIGASFTGGSGSSGTLLLGAPAFMQYAPVANQFGTAVITVSAISSTSVPNLVVTPSVSIFTIQVNRNNAPSLATIPAQILGSGTEKSIDLVDISNNNPESSQLVTITGVSSDQAVITNSSVVIDHIPGGRLGKLKLTPIAFTSGTRTATITLTLNDGGDNVAGGVSTSTVNIPLTVFPAFYNQPRFDPIPNNEFVPINSGNVTITITGVADGNGGANVASFTAQSSNTGAIPNPSVNYTPGNNFALLTYNVDKLAEAIITVTATNTGAPANSNGNSSFSRTFKLGGSQPQYTGYTETFANSIVRGANYYSGNERFETFLKVAPENENWFVEGQGSQVTLTPNASRQNAVIVYNKPSSIPQYFAGVWYTPRRLFDLRNNRQLEITVTASVPTKLQFDIFDVDFNRYGLIPISPSGSPGFLINSTTTTLSFCFTGFPGNPNFDMSRVVGVLLNVPHLNNLNGGTDIANWAAYNGTVTISGFKIGDEVSNPGACPVVQSTVNIGNAASPYHLTTDPGVKSVTITGIDAGSNPSGANLNSVSLSAASSNTAVASSVSVSSVNNKTAIVTYTTSATVGTSTISVTGIATNSIQTVRTFTVNVQTPPSTIALLTITNDLNANFPDGRKGQTIEGFGVTANTEGINDGVLDFQGTRKEVVDGIRDIGQSCLRIAVLNDFESINDNNDPNKVNRDGFNYESLKLHVESVKNYVAAATLPGEPTAKVIASSWGHPAWLKHNKQTRNQTSDGWIIDNTIDSANYAELVEFYYVYVTAMKEAGVDLYALSFVNEPQFNQFYPQTMINRQQFVDILKALGKKFEDNGIKTLIFGPETLPAQEVNTYLNQVESDATARRYLNAHAIHNYDTNGSSPDPNNQNPGSWQNLLNGVRTFTESGTEIAASKYFNHPQTSPNSTGNGDRITIPIWQTETSGFSYDWAGGMATANVLYNALNFGNVNLWTFWTPGTLHFDGSFGLREPGAAAKHFFKYIRPGARRVPAVDNNASLAQVAFHNPDNSLTAVLLNNGSSMITVTIGGTNLPAHFRVFQSVANQFWQELATVSSSIVLPPNSISTLWGGAASIPVPVSSITVSPASSVISVPGGTRNLSASVLPNNASLKDVTWSVTSGSGSINENGVFTANQNGNITIQATSISTPSVFGTTTISVTGAFNPITGITVSGADITTNGGTSSMSVSNFLPANATNPSFAWSVINGSGIATIDGMSGILKAFTNGVVTVTASAVNNSSVKGYKIVNISGQLSSTVNPTSIFVYGGTGNRITIDNLPINMFVDVQPSIATNQNVTWSVIDDDPTFTLASISTTTGFGPNVGVLDPAFNGVVTVVATSIANPSISGRAVVTITGQVVPVIGFSISGTGGIKAISTNKQTLQMTSTFFPINANDTRINWFIVGSSNGLHNSTDISPTGLYTPYANGIVSISGTPLGGATSLTGVWVVTVTNQSIRSISITPTSGNTDSITGVTLGSLGVPTTTLRASYLPANAVNTSVGWAIDVSSAANGTTNILNARDAEITGSSNGILNVKVSSTTDPDVFTIYPVHVNMPLQITGPNSILGTVGQLSVTSLFGFSFTGQNANTSVIPTEWTVAPSSFASVTQGGDLLASPSVTAQFDGIITLTGSLLDLPSIKANKIIRVGLPSRILPIAISGVIGLNADFEPVNIDTLKGTNLISLDAQFLPLNSTAKDVIWSVSDENLLSIDPQTGGVTVKNTGMITITVTSQFNTDAYYVFTAYALGSSVSGINNELSENVTAYPNPASSTIFFRSLRDNDQIISVSLINTLGQIVIQSPYSENGVSVSGVNKGVYLAVIQTKSGIVRKTVVVK